MQSGDSNAIDKSILASRIDVSASWIFAVAQVASGVPHLYNPYFFLGSIYAYDIVGQTTGQIVAITLPALQLVLACCLVVFRRADAAHCVSLVMFLGFAALQSYAWCAGLDISCGCFGSRNESTIGLRSLTIVYGLLALSILRNWLRLKDRARTKRVLK